MYYLVAYSLFREYKTELLSPKALHFKQRKDILGNHLFCFQEGSLGCQNAFTNFLDKQQSQI